MCGAGQPHSRHALRFHRVCEVPRPPHSRHALILHRVSAVQVSPTLDTLCASTGYVRCRSAPLSTRSALPQGMWGAETAPLSTRSDPPQGKCGAGQPHSRHALRLHRVCAVQVSPTLDTLCASTGYVRCRDRPTLDTLCASTGYVRCRSAPLSTRSAPPQGMWVAEIAPLSTRSALPQGMCGASQPHSRHGLRLHRVCAVPRPPHSRHALILHRVCAVQVIPTLDMLCASTGYVRCRSAPLSTRSAPPQGMCGASQPHSRHALRFHRVCAVPRPPHSRHALILHKVCAVQVIPTLDMLCASTGYVRCRSAPLSTRSEPTPRTS